MIDRNLKEAKALSRSFVGEVKAKEILKSIGVPIPNGVFIECGSQFPEEISELKPPFALKVVSPKIIHKSDLGGVALNLSSLDEVRRQIEEMTSRLKLTADEMDGFLVEEMSPAGVEMVIGSVHEPEFGHLIMVGLGGIFVEVIKDVSFRLCPISEADALAMIDELKGAPLLNGARGRPKLAKGKLKDILLKIGGKNGLLAQSSHNIVEMDINPVILSEDDAFAVDARIITTEPDSKEETGINKLKPRDKLSLIERFEPLFRPKTIAVLGASARKMTVANSFIRRLKEFGYDGDVIPIHPSAKEIEGLVCARSLSRSPKPIDYAYIAIAADQVSESLENCRGQVQFAQVISSGFGETREGRDLQDQLVEVAHRNGVRILGPNCLGLHSPRGGVTFPKGAIRDIGSVGVVSQSGGLGTDIVKRGQYRGVRFSGLVTLGNSADIDPVDLVEYYLADPVTKVIGLYIENLHRGTRLARLLRERKLAKPVVLLRGGRSKRGQLAAASHTGAIARDGRAWEALEKQAPLINASTLDEFIDALLMMQNGVYPTSEYSDSVILFGNGGGTSVLATDNLSEFGFDVTPFANEIRARLEGLGLPPGSSINNPIDTPVATLLLEDGKIARRILEIAASSNTAGAIVMHINLASFMGRKEGDPVSSVIQSSLDAIQNVSFSGRFIVVLRSDGSSELEQNKSRFREKFVKAGVPVFDEIPAAVRALHLAKRFDRFFNNWSAE